LKKGAAVDEFLEKVQVIFNCNFMSWVIDKKHRVNTQFL